MRTLGTREPNPPVARAQLLGNAFQNATSLVQNDVSKTNCENNFISEHLCCTLHIICGSTLVVENASGHFSRRELQVLPVYSTLSKLYALTSTPFQVQRLARVESEARSGQMHVPLHN